MTNPEQVPTEHINTIEEYLYDVFTKDINKIINVYMKPYNGVPIITQRKILNDNMDNVIQKILYGDRHYEVIYPLKNGEKVSYIFRPNVDDVRYHILLLIDSSYNVSDDDITYKLTTLDVLPYRPFYL